MKATTPVSMGGTKQAVGTPEYHIQAMNNMYAPPSIAHAKGGIITRPEISLIGEAGREAIIPLEDKSRGIPLLMTAAHELGIMLQSDTASNKGNRVREVIPSVINALRFQSEVNNSRAQDNSVQNLITGKNLVSEVRREASTNTLRAMNIPELMKISSIIPHAEGGIFSQPHIGLVAEAGREAIIPLEDHSRGIPLWLAAGEEMGMSFGASSGGNNNIAPVFAPNVSITVNGSEPEAEEKFRQIAGELFEDLFAQFQNRMQRLAFE